MGNSKGRDNVKKRASRHRKTERLAAAKESSKQEGANQASPGEGATAVK